ncbi:MAG TPA: hypothetical protein DCL77_09105 [Prolixibacteraceae bacterium]|nr:hypothetical protein [Prolixibacteraceae bacterium]
MEKLLVKVPSNGLFIERWIEITAGVTRLTETQQRVLTELLRANKIECTTDARRAVTDKLGFKNLAVTANFIKILKDKGVLLLQEDGKLTYLPLINPPAGTTALEFSFE